MGSTFKSSRFKGRIVPIVPKVCPESYRRVQPLIVGFVPRRSGQALCSTAAAGSKFELALSLANGFNLQRRTVVQDVQIVQHFYHNPVTSELNPR
jgi:hypothetical protein